MVLPQAIHGVGKTLSYNQMQLFRETFHRLTDSGAKRPNYAQVFTSPGGKGYRTGYLLKIPFLQALENQMRTIIVFLVLEGKGRQRSQKTIGVWLVIDGIHELFIGQRITLVEQSCQVIRHPSRQVIVQQESSHVVGRAGVTKDVTSADRLISNSPTIVIASITACAENTHHTWPPATHRTTGAEHISLDMYLACAKGFSEK